MFDIARRIAYIYFQLLTLTFNAKTVIGTHAYMSVSKTSSLYHKFSCG